MNTTYKILIIVISFLIYQKQSLAQNGYADSLERVLKTNKNEIDKINTLILLSENSKETGDISKAKTYAYEGLSLSQKVNYENGIAETSNIIGLIFRDKGNYPEALNYHQDALNIFQKKDDEEGIALTYLYIGSISSFLGDYADGLKNFLSALEIAQKSGFKKTTAHAYNNIANLYLTQGNYSVALKNYFLSLKISEELNDKQGIIKYYNNIGTAYWKQGNYTDALKYFNASLEIAEEINNKDGITTAHNNIGTILSIRGNYSEALKSFRISLKLAEELENLRGISNAYNNIGNIYALQGKYSEALKSLFKTLEIRESIGYKEGIISAHNSLGQVYMEMKNTIAANKHLQKALELSLEIGNKEEVRNSYKNLSQLDSLQGNFKGAYHYFRLYSDIKDSILNEASNNQIAQLKIQYESEKKDKEIVLLNNENNLKAANLEKQKIIRNVIILISILIVLIFIVVLNSLRLRQKRKQQILELEKNKAENLLNSYMTSIKEKNLLIENFSKEIEFLRLRAAPEIMKEREEALNKLCNSVILTEKDWKKFKRLFDEVHKGFFIRLNEKYPDLTTAEKRLLILLKLDLSYDEIASMIGISSESAKQTSLRIRNKLNIKGQNDLFELVETI